MTLTVSHSFQWNPSERQPVRCGGVRSSSSSFPSTTQTAPYHGAINLFSPYHNCNKKINVVQQSNIYPLPFGLPPAPHSPVELTPVRVLRLARNNLQRSLTFTLAKFSIPFRPSPVGTLPFCTLWKSHYCPAAMPCYRLHRASKQHYLLSSSSRVGVGVGEHET